MATSMITAEDNITSGNPEKLVTSREIGTKRYLDTAGAGYNESSGASKTETVNGCSTQWDKNELVNTTNLTAGTYNYDFNIDGRTDLSISGQIVDADGTVTIKVYATNGILDTDTAVQVGGTDDTTGAFANTLTVTNGTLPIAISFNKANYSNWRVEVVCSGSTNTVELLAKVKY